MAAETSHPYRDRVPSPAYVRLPFTDAWVRPDLVEMVLVTEGGGLQVFLRGREKPLWWTGTKWTPEHAQKIAAYLSEYVYGR